VTTVAEFQKLREQLADVQHGIWAHWMNYLFSVCKYNEDGSVTIPADKAERWMRQQGAAYSDLTDKERESDRHQADKVLVLLPQLGEVDIDRYGADQWRRGNAGKDPQEFDEWRRVQP
jgi:hypothetical protein